MTAARLIVRKTRAHGPQLLGLGLLLVVGVTFFVTLFTIARQYEVTAEQYFVDNHYADVTFYGAFDDEHVRVLSAQPGVTRAEGRFVRDYRSEDMMLRADIAHRTDMAHQTDIIFRTISLTDGFNIPYCYEGRMPETAWECVLLRRNADAMGLSIGDTVTVGDKTLTITGLVASPEYIYLSKNERTMMAQPDRFAVLFVIKAFFPEGYNEIVAMTDDPFAIDDAAQAIGAYQGVWRRDQLNHYLYRSDLGEIRSFAYIFPLIFAALIAVVIFVMLSRAIQQDRKQIGTMKALGMPDRRIIGIYLSPFCIAAVLGSVAGCFSAAIISDFIIGVFAGMFEVPTLGFAFYPSLWLGALGVAVVLCALSGWIALRSILPLLPAHALRSRVPRGNRRSMTGRAGFFRLRMSFNSRYALKSAFRNKGRFFAVVLGMCGSCALMVFSLGFNDSIGHTQDAYFEDFANYDIIINFDPLPIAFEHPALARVDTGYKALVMPVEVDDTHYTLAVTEQGFDMVNIPMDELQNGVVIPVYFAQQWNVAVGDTLEINGYTANISAITPQHLGLTLYTSFDYLARMAKDLPPVYNTIYARTGDMAALSAFLKEHNMDYGTIDDDNTSFDSIMESMSVLIVFMIGCAVVLGLTVLYAVGLITLSAREYEYLFMGVMGYTHRSIMSAHIKETLMQLVMAMPLGFMAGNILLESVKGEFSGSSFVISAVVFPESYALSALVVLCVTAVMAAVTSRHIGRLDWVAGLKEQDE